MILVLLACGSGTDSSADKVDSGDSAPPARVCMSVSGVEHSGDYATCLGQASTSTTVLGAQGLPDCDNCTFSLLWFGTPSGDQTCASGLYVTLKDDAFASVGDGGTVGYAGSATGSDPVGECAVTTTSYAVGDDGTSVSWTGSGTATLTLIDTFGNEVGTRVVAFEGDLVDGA